MANVTDFKNAKSFKTAWDKSTAQPAVQAGSKLDIKKVELIVTKWYLNSTTFFYLSKAYYASVSVSITSYTTLFITFDVLYQIKL